MSKRPRACPEVRNLIEWAKELGFICEVTGGTHIVFRRPNTQPVYTSSTPSCPRATANAKAQLKRAIRKADQAANAGSLFLGK